MNLFDCHIKTMYGVFIVPKMLQNKKSQSYFKMKYIIIINYQYNFTVKRIQKNNFLSYFKLN